MKPLRLLATEPFSQVLKYLIMLVCAAWIGWFGLKTAKAQEATPVNDPGNEIQILPPLHDQIQDLKAQYRAELENYRTLDRQTKIANSQYEQLQTLVSLETAVTTLKNTMVSRAAVLDLYLRLLRLELIQAPGIEVTAKKALEMKLDESIEKIAIHKKIALSAEDRTQLAAVTEDFDELGPDVESVAYETQSQLALSRLQSVYDKIQVVRVEVQSAMSSNSAVLQQAAQTRAFAETDRNLEVVLSDLNKSQNQLNEQGQFSSSSHRSFTNNLDDIYTGLLQSLNFLSELAGISTNDR